LTSLHDMVKYPKRRNMTLAELKDWMKKHPCIDTERDCYDECGNHEETKIYQVGDKLFGVELLNGEPYHNKGDYQLHEVIKKTYTATYYEFV
jgi:hypothetical protein